MKVLIAGSNSYIATHLIPYLTTKGHEVVCVARDKKYFLATHKTKGITVLNGDLLRSRSIEPFPEDIDAAFYLANRLTQTSGFAGLEALSAQNFMDALNLTQCRQLITTGELNNPSRDHIEHILAAGKAALTGMQISMVIGDGSIAMDLFDALTRNTPIVITNAWAGAQIQPVYIEDALAYLHDCLLNRATYNRKFDICGPQILTFKQMMLLYIATYKTDADRPNIVILPSLNARLASYLANFLSPINYPEAQSLLENLKYDSVSGEDPINDVIPRECATFKESLKLIHDKDERVVHV
jgi:uncharacterized protein YbjT (DUF2867 family)